MDRVPYESRVARVAHPSVGHADIGISLPGAGEDPGAPVYVDGKLAATLSGPSMAEDFLQLLDEYVETRFGGGGRSGS